MDYHYVSVVLPWMHVRERLPWSGCSSRPDTDAAMLGSRSLRVAGRLICWHVSQKQWARWHRRLDAYRKTIKGRETGHE